MAKKRVITNTMQEVAADVLIRFIVGMHGNFTEEQFMNVIHEVYESYGLQDDPFVGFPCSNREYAESCEEYARQKMEERFGYYE